MRVRRRFHEAIILDPRALLFCACLTSRSFVFKSADAVNRGLWSREWWFNALRYASAGNRTIEMLGFVAPKVRPVSNYMQQVPTLLWYHGNGPNLLGPTMLRVISQQCCVRLHGLCWLPLHLFLLTHDQLQWVPCRGNILLFRAIAQN